VTVDGGPTGSVKVRIVRPPGAGGTLPVVLYVHGAGWVFGDAHTHDRLVRDLAGAVVDARALGLEVVHDHQEVLVGRAARGTERLGQRLAR
jgi:hypothetical protein